jgi:4-hydroxybenzoate polyprenyltransferase
LVSTEKSARAWHLLIMTLIFAGFKYYGIVINEELDLNDDRIEDWHGFR